MNRKEKEILRNNHGLLVENINTIYIRPFLYERGVVEDEMYLDNEPIPERRAEILLKHVKNNCSFELFLQALEYNDSYLFLSETLKNDMGNISKQRKIDLTCSRRTRAILFRHKLKRFTHEHNYEEFDRLYDKAVDEWELASLERLEETQRQELADTYFMAIDAKIEQRRVIYDKTLHKSDLFEKLAKISHHTTNPTLPTIMQLARYGTAILLDNRGLAEAKTCLELAKQQMEGGSLPACRETGLVIYIEFNIELQINEQNCTKLDKEKFAKLGREAAGHFAVEQEHVGNDFKRILLLKIAHVFLGIGLFLNFVEDLQDVTQDHVHEAESILHKIEEDEDLWNRMELRAKMVYHVIKSRTEQIKGNVIQSLEFSNKAMDFANQGQFTKEIESINRNNQFLEELKNIS